LGGNARTTIVICCSPSSYNESETLSSLRFGQRAKKIRNNAVVNVQYSAEELEKQLDAAKKEMRKIARRLQAAFGELNIWRCGGHVPEAERVPFEGDLAAFDVAPGAAAAGLVVSASAEGGAASVVPVPPQQTFSDEVRLLLLLLSAASGRARFLAPLRPRSPISHNCILCFRSARLCFTARQSCSICSMKRYYYFYFCAFFAGCVNHTEFPAFDLISGRGDSGAAPRNFYFGTGQGDRG
jgi:hypothetical protein